MKLTYEKLTVEYDRSSVPCPDCPDEPWPYIVMSGTRLTVGSFLKVGENSYRGTIEGPAEFTLSLSVNDRKMFDRVNEYSWTEVGEFLRVNGVPLRINSKNCSVPWSGSARFVVHLDASIALPN